MSTGSLLAAPLVERDLTKLSLEELLSIDVQLVSLKGDSLHESPAAVYVLKREIIARSGASTIPELLRLVPGVQVTRFASHQWSVNIRGFNDGAFTNRILILVDGRDVFSPAKAGMFWDALDLPLDDIDRIEVVRGPGTALWGGNAFNGVINIVTRRAVDTQGGLASFGGGDEEKWFAGLRYGQKLADGYARAYIKAKEFDDMVRRDGMHRDIGDNHDGWHSLAGGLRFDRGNEDAGAWSFQVNAYDGGGAQELVLPDIESPSLSSLMRKDIRFSGVAGQLDWHRRTSEDSLWRARFYLDHSERDDLLFDLRVDTLNLELEQDYRWGFRQRLVWGLAYRYSEDHLGGEVLFYDPARSHYSQASGFLHYEYALLPERFRLITGVRLEDSDFGGSEIQPNARLVWAGDQRQSFWLAVSQANRSPSRAERDGQGNLDLQPLGGGASVAIQYRGLESFDAENLTAYEAGWRHQMNQRLSLDLALFYKEYEDLRSLEPGMFQPNPSPPPTFMLPVLAVNGLEARSWGGELLLDIVLSPHWHIEAHYSHLQVHIDSGASADLEGGTAERVSPLHQAVLNAHWDLSARSRCTLVLRHMDKLTDQDIPEYTELDLVLSQQFGERWKVFLMGKNLLDDAHEEFVDARIGAPRAGVERSLALKVQLDF